MDKISAAAKAKEEATAKIHGRINSVFRNPRPGSRITVIEKTEQSEGSKVMNAFLRSDPDPTASFSDKDLKDLITENSKDIANNDIREKARQAASGSGGEGTGTIHKFKKPETMNDAIREIMDLRKKLSKPGNR